MNSVIITIFINKHSLFSAMNRWVKELTIKRGLDGSGVEIGSGNRCLVDTHYTPSETDGVGGVVPKSSKARGGANPIIVISDVTTKESVDFDKSFEFGP